MSDNRSQRSWPSLLPGRPRKKRTAWQPSLPWQDRHHVVPSKSNKHVVKSQRWYFDRLSAVGWKRGEFNDIFSFNPRASDLDDHRENIRRIFVQFPQYVPAKFKGKRPHSRLSWHKDPYLRETADANLTTEGPHETTASQADDDDSELGEINDARHRRFENQSPNQLNQLTDDALSDPPSRPASRKSSLAVQHHRGTMQPHESVDASRRASRHLWVSAKKSLGIDADCAPTRLLMEWCKMKRFNIVTIWRRLDTDHDMMLKKHEFTQGMKNCSYPENLEDLWKSLDKDHTGTISFLEFAPEHALDLMRFKHWVEDKFGNLKSFFNHLDSDHNGKLTFQEFSRACEFEGMPKRCAESIRTLFLLCDDPDDVTSKGTINEHELNFLEVWKVPLYLREKPDLAARMQFQDRLLSLHDRNPFIAWRVALDRDESMRVGFSEFETTCRNLRLAGFKEADPPTGVPALYCALDINRSGWFSLRDWDKDMHTILHKFHTFCRERYLKVSQFVRNFEDSWGSGIGVGTFSKAIADLEMEADDRVILFDGLSVGRGKRQNILSTKPDKKVYVQDVLFLDEWKPEEELRADMAWEKKVIKRMGTYLKGTLTESHSFGHDEDSPRKSKGQNAIHE